VDELLVAHTPWAHSLSIKQIKPMKPVRLMIGLLLLLTIGCGQLLANHEADLKVCRFEMNKLPHAMQMGNDQRLRFLNACMEAKGWTASKECRKQTMQGTQFCKYERA
jgi:hypothetical protein